MRWRCWRVRLRRTIPLGGGSVLSRVRKPDFAVVDLQRLGLNKIDNEGQLLHIGATVTLQQIFEYENIPAAIQEAMRESLLHETALNLRQVATVAGCLASCDGRSSFVTALLALDARLVWAPGEEAQSLGDYLPLREEFGLQPDDRRCALPVECNLALCDGCPFADGPPGGVRRGGRLAIGSNAREPGRVWQSADSGNGWPRTGGSGCGRPRGIPLC